jgi:hypothetical protein
VEKPTTRTVVIGAVKYQYVLKCGPIGFSWSQLKTGTLKRVWTWHQKNRVHGERVDILLTAINVPGKKNALKTAITFITVLSRFV